MQTMQTVARLMLLHYARHAQRHTAPNASVSCADAAESYSSRTSSNMTVQVQRPAGSVHVQARAMSKHHALAFAYVPAPVW